MLGSSASSGLGTLGRLIKILSDGDAQREINALQSAIAERRKAHDDAASQIALLADRRVEIGRMNTELEEREGDVTTRETDATDKETRLNGLAASIATDTAALSADKEAFEQSKERTSEEFRNAREAFQLEMQKARDKLAADLNDLGMRKTAIDTEREELDEAKEAHRQAIADAKSHLINVPEYAG